MMTDALRIMLWIFLCLCLVSYGIDFMYYLKDRFCRYHIGRWDKEAWIAAVEKRAFIWAKKTPTVKVSDNNRYILLDMATGKYRSSTIQSWQKAALVMGLIGCKDMKKKQRAIQVVDEYFGTTGMWKQKPSRIDSGLLSYVALQTVENPLRIKPAMDYMLEVINRNINDQGLISYTGGKNDSELYVDTIGLAVPFLTAYAKYYGSSEYEELGFKQLRAFHDNGLLTGSNLPNHAYDSVTGLPIGVFGWGRGTGWYVLGLIESLDMFIKAEYRDIVKGWIFDAAEEYIGFQHEDGGFGSIFQSKGTYDSSATAVMAYFYAKASKIFCSNEYYLVADRCMCKLRKCTRLTGAIDWCQGDTKAIGVFSQRYDIMPFAQGMTLRAFNELRQDM